MKIEQNIVVVLKSSDGDAKFTFAAPKMNELYRHQEDSGTEKDSVKRSQKEFQWSFAQLKKVEGLTDEEGKEITVEQVRAMDLPTPVMLAVYNGYVEGYTSKLRGKEPEAEKKDS